MLRTRIWMGALLIAVAGLILLEERWFAPWYPFLFIATAGACGLAVRELLGMLDSGSRPSAPLCLLGVFSILAANSREPFGVLINVWHLIGAIYVSCGIVAFLLELWNFRGPNRIAERIGQTFLVIFYLGVLPSFLLQLRVGCPRTRRWPLP